MAVLALAPDNPPIPLRTPPPPNLTPRPRPRLTTMPRAPSYPTDHRRPRRAPRPPRPVARALRAACAQTPCDWDRALALIQLYPTLLVRRIDVQSTAASAAAVTAPAVSSSSSSSSPVPPTLVTVACAPTSVLSRRPRLRGGGGGGAAAPSVLSGRAGAGGRVFPDVGGAGAGVGYGGLPAQLLLHRAASENKPGYAALLLSLGADPAALDGRGEVPLHRACGLGRLEIAEMLLAAGAHVDGYCSAGYRGTRTTPLTLAIQGQHVEVVRLLLRHHADKGIRDKWGRTPVAMAKKMEEDAERCVQKVRAMEGVEEAVDGGGVHAGLGEREEPTAYALSGRRRRERGRERGTGATAVVAAAAAGAAVAAARGPRVECEGTLGQVSVCDGDTEQRDCGVGDGAGDDAAVAEYGGNRLDGMGRGKETMQTGVPTGNGQDVEEFVDEMIDWIPKPYRGGSRRRNAYAWTMANAQERSATDIPVGCTRQHSESAEKMDTSIRLEHSIRPSNVSQMGGLIQGQTEVASLQKRASYLRARSMGPPVSTKATSFGDSTMTPERGESVVPAPARSHTYGTDVNEYEHGTAEMYDDSTVTTAPRRMSERGMASGTEHGGHTGVEAWALYWRPGFGEAGYEKDACSHGAHRPIRRRLWNVRGGYGSGASKADQGNGLSAASARRPRRRLLNNGRRMADWKRVHLGLVGEEISMRDLRKHCAADAAGDHVAADVYGMCREW